MSIRPRPSAQRPAVGRRVRGRAGRRQAASARAWRNQAAAVLTGREQSRLEPAGRRQAAPGSVPNGLAGPVVRTLAGLLVAGLLAGCGLPPTDRVTPSATPRERSSATPSPEAPACLATATALSLAERAGQLVMVGVDGNLDDSESETITRHHIGSVILMGTAERGVAQTAKLTGEIQQLAGAAGVLVAVDQEGGLVQRLNGPGFSDIPSAAEQAKLPDDELSAQAEDWGEQLLEAGVHLNLAPVADVVPPGNQRYNEPIAQLNRGYGTDPDVVWDKVNAYLGGMARAGEATAVKHFPGLGAVRGNTDFENAVVDDSTTANSDLLEPFRRALTPSPEGTPEQAAADAVMISSAVYDRIDPRHQAVFSPTVIGIVRDWGFDGVVLSDDLGAAKALADVPVADRAASFIGAGGDLAVTVAAATAGELTAGIVDRAEQDPAFAAQVTRSAARVLALKQAHGLTSCGG